MKECQIIHVVVITIQSVRAVKGSKLRDVAQSAGVPIRYSCKKGEL